MNARSSTSQNGDFTAITTKKQGFKYPKSKSAVTIKQIEAVAEAVADIRERLAIVEYQQRVIISRFSGGGNAEVGKKQEKPAKDADSNCRGARGFIGLERRFAEVGLKFERKTDENNAENVDKTDENNAENVDKTDENNAENVDKTDEFKNAIADFCEVNSTGWKKGTANKWRCFLDRVEKIHATAGGLNGEFFATFKAVLEEFKNGTRVLYWGRLRLFLSFLVDEHDYDKKILRFIPKTRSVGGAVSDGGDVLTRERAEKIAEATENDDLKDYLKIAVNTGLRSGEILALTADDVAEKDGEFYLTITKTARAKRDGGLSGGCKTKTSARIVQLNDDAAGVVLRRAKNGGFLFADKRGDYYASTNFLHDDFKRACEICGFSPATRLYSTRAGYVCDALDVAKDNESFNRSLKAVAKNCGHSNVGTTLASYNKITA